MQRSNRRHGWVTFVSISLSLCHLTEAAELTLNQKAVVVDEKETSSPELTHFSCTPTPCSVDVVSVSPSSPCGSCFAVFPCINPADGYCLRYVQSQGYLDPLSAPRYTLTLRASDSTTVTEDGRVDVHVRPNSPPYFDCDDFGGTLHKTETLSGPVTVAATDLDSDSLTYSMTTVPSVDGIEIDSLSGTISATSDLRTLCRSSVTALVYAKDDHHSELAGPLAVTLEIPNPNDRPIINNLNTEVYMRENEGPGTEVLDLAVYDEVGNDLTYTMTASPTSASGLFEINEADGKLVVKETPDYETFPNGVTLSIKASDGFCESETYQLKVKLVDLNEPPVLLPVDQTLDVSECAENIHPNWENVSDPDIGDEIRFTKLTPNTNGRFRIDEKTGVVSPTADYDLDVEKLPATVTNTVIISDRQGATATATLTFRFYDCNDNAPEYSQPAKDYMIRDCWPAGRSAGLVVPTDDKDSTYNLNNVFTHSGSGPGVEVQESGAIVLTQQFSAGQTVTFPAYATDKGKEPGPLTSKPFWISIYTLPCLDNTPTPDEDTTTTTTTQSTQIGANDLSFWGSNLWWLIPALLLALPLLALPFLLLWRYWSRLQACWGDRRPCCPPKEEPPARPITPTRKPSSPPEKEPPGYNYGFWKETYRDNDYERTPNRQALPEPSKGPEPVETNTYDFVPDSGPAMAAPPSSTPKAPGCHIL